MKSCIWRRVFCLPLALVMIASTAVLASGQANTTTKMAGLVTASDGFTYYYDKIGNMVKNDYVKIDDNTIYYFCANGRGVKEIFKVLNKNLVQIWNGEGSTSIFIVIGNNKALMIDGIFGFGNLKKLAAFFTDKPVSIAFTHASVDHSGAGNDINQFKEIYINPFENERFAAFGKSPFRRFTNDVNERNRYSKPIDYYDTISVDDYTQYSSQTKLLPMNDGMKFDLGGLTVEAIWAPGHQPGCTSFLLKEPKILIGGDCAGGGLNDYTVEDYRTTILKYIVRENEYTSIYSSHGKEDTSLPLYWFKSMLEVCDLVLTGKIKGVPQGGQQEYQVYGGKGVRWSTRGVARPSTGALDSRFLSSLKHDKDEKVANLSYDPELILNFQK